MNGWPDREYWERARICVCDATRGESCAIDDGTAAEQREYRQATRPQRRAHDAAMAAWWLRADDQRNTA